ncbi:hypothetical protein F4802DRAFT_598591 [Xylaria palmicola]|nr:hypothetical protein F4802DRAFT_598591 [Xylaria palmicola]
MAPPSSSSKHRITKRAAPSKASKAKTRSKMNAESADRVMSDVLLSIKSVHLANIISQKKNHEYRKYRLRDGVERLWLYETADGGGKSSITHVAAIPDDVRHTPGSVPTEPFGIGNEDFNAGLKVSKYGYPILHLYELVKPVTLAEMKSKWAMGGAPMGWRYVGTDLWTDRWGGDDDRGERVKQVF